MKIVITEDQKKKLFVPRDIDTRREQFNDEIKKFLLSVKESVVWEYLGSIEMTYNYEFGDSNIYYYDKRGNHFNEGGLMKGDLIKDLNVITDFMDKLLDIPSDGEVTYVWNKITRQENGGLGYEQHKEIKISEKIRDIEV